MASINIQILNPKAKKLLQSLVDLRLITISEENDNAFLKALKSFRSKKTSLSLEDITSEVEAVRKKRYAK